METYINTFLTWEGVGVFIFFGIPNISGCLQVDQCRRLNDKRRGEMNVPADFLSFL